jgi:hypothetical protein
MWNRDYLGGHFSDEQLCRKQVGSVFAKLGLDPSRHAHLDRRVTAVRIYYQSRPQEATVGMPERALSHRRAAAEATAYDASTSACASRSDCSSTMQTLSYPIRPM